MLNREDFPITFVTGDALIKMGQAQKRKLKQLKIDYLVSQGYTVYDAYNDITYKPSEDEKQT